MKIKAGNVGPGALPLARERVIVQENNGVLTAQKWPKKRGKAKSGYDFFRQQEFGIAAKMAITPLDLDYETAVNMVKGTSYVPRDFLVMCAYGRAYEIVMPDGTQWENFRDVTNNPQYVLDQVTDVPGSMLYRTEQGWIGLAPASDGLVLSMSQGLPAWRAGSTISGGFAWYTPQFFAVAALNQNFRGNNISPVVPITIGKIAPYASAGAGWTYQASIWTFDDMPTLGEKIADSTTYMTTETLTQYLPMEFTPIELEPNRNYLMAVQRVGVTGNFDNKIALGNPEGLPFGQLFAIQSWAAAVTDPAPGQVLTSPGRCYRIGFSYSG